MHQLLAHNPAFDAVFFTTQFLEGLKHEIRAGVCYINQRTWTPHSLWLRCRRSSWKHCLAGSSGDRRRLKPGHRLGHCWRWAFRRCDPLNQGHLRLLKIAGAATQHTHRSMVSAGMTASQHCGITDVRGGYASSVASVGAKATNLHPQFSCISSKSFSSCCRQNIKNQRSNTRTMQRTFSCLFPSWQPQGKQHRTLSDS